MTADDIVMNRFKSKIYRIAVAIMSLSLLYACDGQDTPDPNGNSVPEGMVEIRPVLPGMYNLIPRDPAGAKSVVSRAYPDNEQTNADLGRTHRLPHGATVWLIAESVAEDRASATFVKRSYVVFNPENDETMSYLVPCTVDDDGNVVDQEGAPLYLKNGNSYKFFAISPARKLDEAKFANDTIAFQVKNGEAFYANDCRYSQTTPEVVQVKSDNTEAIQIVSLKPMMNQTAQLKVQIRKGSGVHDLDIQPAGIEISGLQNDSPTPGIYGNDNGLYWHMSQSGTDEPIKLQHGDKTGIFYCYDYTVDTQGYVNIEVPVLPMRSLSKPVIVIFRLKINGVPTSYEIMLNEKDFKAGYSYGYQGEVSIEKGVTVVTWQFVSWETEVEFPF